MAVLKQSDAEQSRRIARAEIEACILRSGLSKEQVLVTCGFKETTFYGRKKCPDDWQLSELQRLAKKSGMTPLQAASIILGRQVTASEIK